MIKMKPVWRMNTEEKVPSDLGSRILVSGESFSEGSSLHHVKNHIRRDSEVWNKSDIIPIIAYQTNRTKKAKYQKVDCRSCKGEGKKVVNHLTCPALTVCARCKGLGHAWELIR